MIEHECSSVLKDSGEAGEEKERKEVAKVNKAQAYPKEFVASEPTTNTNWQQYKKTGWVSSYHLDFVNL
jgi:hypothetical protein